MFKKLFLCVVLFTIPLLVSADIFKLKWDYPVPDSRAEKFVVAWGNTSKQYSIGNVKVPGDTLTATSPDLAKGTYYLAVKACTSDEKLCSAWSNEISVTAKGPIAPPSGFILESVTFTIK